MFLMDLLKIIFENYFVCKETNFLQLRGAEMGSIVAPLYANTFIDMDWDVFHL